MGQKFFHLFLSKNTDLVSSSEALAECTLNLTNIFKNAYREKKVINIPRQFVEMSLPYKDGVTGSVELDIQIVPEEYDIF